MILLSLQILTTVSVNSELTESVVFHPVHQIYNSISSWIITTAIDFMPYRTALLSVNVYTIRVKESLIGNSSTFQNSDPRYSHISKSDPH